MMDVGYRTELLKEQKNDTRRELTYYIEEAKNGELSPHWQECLRREVREAGESGRLPDDADVLLKELEATLATVPQLSDTELNRRQLAESGTELLYHYPCDDYGTLLEINYTARKNHYTAYVYLDEDAAAQDPCGYAKTIEDALWAWLRGQNIAFTESEIPATPPEAEPEYFDDMPSVLRYLFSSLRHPQELML